MMNNSLKYFAVTSLLIAFMGCSKVNEEQTTPKVREITIGIPLSVSKGEFSASRGVDPVYSFPEGKYPLDFVYVWVITGGSANNLEFTPLKFTASGTPTKVDIKVYENAEGTEAWIGDADSLKGVRIEGKPIMIASVDRQIITLDQDGYSFSGNTPIYKCLTLKGLANAQGVVDGDIVFRQKNGYYIYDFEKKDFAEYNDLNVKTGTYLSAGVALRRLTAALNINFVLTDLNNVTYDEDTDQTKYSWSAPSAAASGILGVTFKRYATNIGLSLDMVDPVIVPEAYGTLLVASTDGDIGKNRTSIYHSDNVHNINNVYSGYGVADAEFHWIFPSTGNVMHLVLDMKNNATNQIASFRVPSTFTTEVNTSTIVNMVLDYRSFLDIKWRYADNGARSTAAQEDYIELKPHLVTVNDKVVYSQPIK